MELSELFSLKVSKGMMTELDEKAKQLNTSKADIVRRAIKAYNRNSSTLTLTLSEGEWEYLRVVATHNKCTLDTAIRLIMEGYYTLLNMPLSKSIKPLGELREEFVKVTAED